MSGSNVLFFMCQVTVATQAVELRTNCYMTGMSRVTHDVTEVVQSLDM